MSGLSVKNVSNGHNSATRHPINFVFGSTCRLGFFSNDELALFNLHVTAHELHELYYYDVGLLLREALDRRRVRLNMYLVLINTLVITLSLTGCVSQCSAATAGHCATCPVVCLPCSVRMHRLLVLQLSLWSHRFHLGRYIHVSSRSSSASSSSSSSSLSKLDADTEMVAPPSCTVRFGQLSFRSSAPSAWNEQN